uniref:Uncharacterized protein n=1 Tax=Siphoviridae sp. ctR0j7 TaxID=2823580 RepID=A0A8S5LHU6_9CAUD|nr:MAG TPA: hypothetical protein [Siphoviridae sp. ctR0j7]
MSCSLCCSILARASVRVIFLLPVLFVAMGVL